MPRASSPLVAHAADDLDQEVTRQGLPPDIMPAYDGTRLVLENRQVVAHRNSIAAAEEFR